MSAHRFFISEPPDLSHVPAQVPLTREDLSHATSVVRLRAGEAIELVLEDGRLAWSAAVDRASRDGVWVSSVEPMRAQAPSRVTLFQGIAKGDKMDTIVRQAVEIGVAAVVPLSSERTVVRLDTATAAVKVERWQRVARAAAAQSHAPSVPNVEPVATLERAAMRLADFDLVLVFWEEATATDSLARACAGVSSHARVAVIVGPEGGISSEEIALLVDAGARIASLGSRVLRVDTAAVVALALVAAELERQV